MRRVFVFVVALVLVVSLSAPAAAASTYPTGTTGADISWPQCGGTYPSTAAFGIVGVTGGHAFTQNACLASEFAWASGTGTWASASRVSPASLYLNLNYAVGSTASNGSSGPYGSCKRGSTCFAENYGWNAAQDAFSYAGASGASAATWWLDIETSNSWSVKTTLNQAVIQGAIDCLLGSGPNGASCAGSTTSTGITTVGIYSTPSMWQTITGGWQAHSSTGMVSPNWVATGASGGLSSCAAVRPLWSGGQVWLAQYVANNVDWDYAC